MQLGVVGAAFMWMYALFGPLAGWLCDRLPRKTLVLAGLILWSLVTALTAACHNYAQLVLCRALSGLGEAVYLPASMSLIGDYHGAGARSRAMSVRRSRVYVGSIAGGALSGLIGQYYGWRWSPLGFGFCGMLFGAVVGKLLKETGTGRFRAGGWRFLQPSGRASSLARRARVPATHQGGGPVDPCICRRKLCGRGFSYLDAFVSVSQILAMSLEHGRIKRRCSLCSSPSGR